LVAESEPLKISRSQRLPAEGRMTNKSEAPMSPPSWAALADPSSVPQPFVRTPGWHGKQASPGAQDKISSDLSFIASSRVMNDVRSQIRQVAGFDIPVLLLGESGTGKGIVAQMIHNLSSRSSQRFMKLNCAAVPADLLESELFGHEAGAFTGAARAKPGKFEVCDGGTILMDEIAEMPTGLQAKLLHVLQDGEFSRLGSSAPVRVDVRVIAATNMDLAEAIAAGKFREDLYYRLNVYAIYLPPVRERPADIPDLIEHFMRIWAERFGCRLQPVSPALLDACLEYPWPGNVREIENFVRRLLIIGDSEQAIRQLRSSPDGNGNGNTIAVPLGAHETRATTSGDLKSHVRHLKDVAEREAITQALISASGNRTKAARHLNISVRGLQYKIRSLGIAVTRAADVRDSAMSEDASGPQAR
jgi:two-component system, NtrC family, response regulator AtoC